MNVDMQGWGVWLALSAACIGTYAIVAAGSPAMLGLPLLAVGLLVSILGITMAARRSVRTRYRPDPWWLAEWDNAFYGAPEREITRESVEAQMVDYMEREVAQHGTHWYSIARHMLGLRHGLPGARRWRQVWTDHRLKHLSAREVMAMAHQAEPNKVLAPV